MCLILVLSIFIDSELRKERKKICKKYSIKQSDLSKAYKKTNNIDLVNDFRLYKKKGFHLIIIWFISIVTVFVILLIINFYEHYLNR